MDVPLYLNSDKKTGGEMPNNRDWYYIDNGEKIGPLSALQLKNAANNGTLNKSNLIWGTGLKDWSMAGDSKGLFDNSPPPVPNQSLDFKYSVDAVSYAGFWKRTAAIIIDMVVFNACLFSLFFILTVAQGVIYGSVESTFINTASEHEMNGLGLIFFWLYFLIMESSKYQGTLGKIILGIKVTDIDGNKINIGKASARHFSKIISSVLLIGFFAAAFTKKKQAFHDSISGCLVVNK